MGSRVQWNDLVRPLDRQWVARPQYKHVCARTARATRADRPRLQRWALVRLTAASMARLTSFDHQARRTPRGISASQSTGVEVVAATVRSRWSGWTAAGNCGDFGRGTPLGCRTRSLIRPISASAEPPLPCARPRIRDDMHVIIRPSNLGWCLNCRSAMSPGVVGPPQLYGVPVWSQPPQELDRHSPLLRSRQCRSSRHQPILDHAAPGAVLR